MEYTIGKVSEMTGISIDTLRYYDKEGMLPFVKRSSSGRRIFDEKDLSYLETIKCLKHSGVQVKEIGQFIKWCMIGDDTLKERKDFFEKKENELEQKIKNLEAMLAFLRWKKWYYETAFEAGTEEIHYYPGTNRSDPAVRETYNALQKDEKDKVQTDVHFSYY